MYNPFPLLTRGLLTDQLARDKRYFVRQTFPRGMEARLKAAFLIKGYAAAEKDEAESHLAALALDGNAFLYDAQSPEQLQKLQVAAGQPFGYKIFYAAKKGMDWKPPPAYREKMRQYIRQQHPGWIGQRGGEKIQIGLYEEFGELFLKLSYDREQETIPFDHIEKY